MLWCYVRWRRVHWRPRTPPFFLFWRRLNWRFVLCTTCIITACVWALYVLIEYSQTPCKLSELRHVHALGPKASGFVWLAKLFSPTHFPERCVLRCIFPTEWNPACFLTQNIPYRTFTTKVICEWAFERASLQDSSTVGGCSSLQSRQMKVKGPWKLNVKCTLHWRWFVSRLVVFNIIGYRYIVIAGSCCWHHVKHRPWQLSICILYCVICELSPLRKYGRFPQGTPAATEFAD